MAQMMKKKTLRDFLKRPPSKEDEEYFDQAMNAPSDLAAAILLAIDVEHHLEKSIILHLQRRDDATLDMLIRDNGPLGTFNAKIVLAYALGIIDKDWMTILNTIRRIRNVFAHARKLTKFSTPEIRDQIYRLKEPRNADEKLSESIRVARGITNPNMQETDNGPNDLDNSLSLTGRAGYIILCLATIAFLLRHNADFLELIVKSSALTKAKTAKD